MNTLTINNTNSKFNNWMAVVVLFLMFSFSGFSQSQSAANVDLNGGASANVKVEASKATSNMEFALWFMGTKQDPNSTLSTEGTNVKKMIITSGIAPNRLLLKAFLKKVVNHENSLS